MPDESQKPKKTWHKKWTPRKLALYLMSLDMRYVLPCTTNEQIMEEVPNLHCGIGKVSWLRNHIEFQKTVEEWFIDKIKSNYSTEGMFWLYLKHSFNTNMVSDKPTTKLLDVLGILSGKYNPAHVKTDTPKGKEKKMTPAQVARAIHQKEQLEKMLAEPGNMADGEPEEKDGGDGNE
uniref:Uncharacterized protein n=1 Tax=viral metagenome TaxID=1070528 RepID=A0A6H1ZJK0_9ZZZZ